METQELEINTLSLSPADSAIGNSPEKDSAGTISSTGRRRIIKAADKYEPGWIEKERKNLQAYEYLCRVGEAKQWIEAMIKKPIPEIEKLEEELRNGIYLAYLAKSFQPGVVGKIFEDRTKLQYKHSDNTNFLFKAMRKVGLPELFIFELTDLYDKKNFPKVVYCIHALSHLLFKKRLGPSITNLVGKLTFTEETLDKTQQSLDAAGVSLPAFGNLQSALEKELAIPEPTEEEKRARFLEDNLSSIIKCQAYVKGYLKRKQYKARLQELTNSENLFVKLQAIRRAKLVRDAFMKRKKFFKDNEAAVVKIQATWKAKKIEKAYRALASVNNPPVKTLKEFLHLLDDNDFDYQEEIEIEKLRQKVVKMIRENIQTESNLGDLDVKISLLVKNRISLEEVAHLTSKKVKARQNLSDTDLTAHGVSYNLKGNDKETRQKVEHYQNLFYLLQTQPEYLARMMFLMNQKSGGNVTKVLEGYVMALYGYAQNIREEYLLLELITSAVQIEVDDIQELPEFWKSNPLFIKLVLHYTRGAKERQYIRELLQPLIKSILADSSLDLETDPSNIYKSLIREEESSTGEKSKRNYEATIQEIAKDPDVQRLQLQNSLKLMQVSLNFMSSIISSLKKMPYGIRYIAYKLRDSLKLKFKGCDDEIVKIVGHLIYYRYINPAIVAPEGFDVLDAGITPNQRKSLAEIAKVLHLISARKGFAPEDCRPAKLNEFILECNKKFFAFLKEATEVPSAEEYFGMDEYVDLGRYRKPMIYISASEIFEIHRNLAEYADDLTKGKDDPLRIILNDLGTPPPALSSEQQQYAGNEIMLVLSNRFAKLEDPEVVAKNLLYNETKSLLFTIIRIQQGKNLIELLNTPVTQQDEQLYEDYVNKENQKQNAVDSAEHDVSTLANTKKFVSVSNIVKSSDGVNVGFSLIKTKAQENLTQLEKFGFVKKENEYQDILNDIARDMLNKHRRRKQRARELESLRKTLKSIEEKSTYLEDQRKSYHDYVQSCMSQFSNKKSKQKRVLPFTRQYFHLRELQKTGRMPKFGSYKYTAEQLYKKGVVVSIADFSVKQYDKITITISSNEAGVFNVQASFLGLKVESTEIRLEDLLQYQYENVSILSMFDGVAKLNVNLLVYLVNKKFYA